MIPISESTLGAEIASAEADAEAGLSGSAWAGAHGATGAISGAVGGTGCGLSPTSASVDAEPVPPEALSNSASTFSLTIPNSLSAPSLLQTCLGMTLPGSSSLGQGFGSPGVDTGALASAGFAGLAGLPGIAGLVAATGGSGAGAGSGQRTPGCGMTRTVTLAIPHTFTRCANVRWGPIGLATWRLRFVRCALSRSLSLSLILMRFYLQCPSV